LTIITFLAVIAVQSWSFLFVPTDFNGDPNDYVGIAMNSFQGISTIRMFGYPLFLTIVSFNFSALNLIFLAQSIVFLLCLRYFAITLVSKASLRWIVYSVALIPSVAYTQKLLFPDGLILSLMLLFLGLLVNKRYGALTAISLVLVSIKLVFVFLFPLVLAIYVIDRSWISITKTFALVNLSTFMMLVLVFASSPFSIYQTTVQEPTFVDQKLAGPDIPDNFTFSCNSVDYILQDVIDIDDAKIHSADVMTPLLNGLNSKLNCNQREIAKVQRDLVVLFIMDDPSTQFVKFVYRFTGGTLGIFQVNHVAYMLSVKNQLLESDTWAQYSSLEIQYFQTHGLQPPLPPAQILLANSYVLSVGGYAAICILSVMLILGFAIFGKVFKRPFFNSLHPLLFFWITYNLLIASNGFNYDRYLFINGFILTAALASALSNMYRPAPVQIQNT
jgi:hypothetical protein